MSYSTCPHTTYLCLPTWLWVTCLSSCLRPVPLLCTASHPCATQEHCILSLLHSQCFLFYWIILLNTQTYCNLSASFLKPTDILLFAQDKDFGALMKIFCVIFVYILMIYIYIYLMSINFLVFALFLFSNFLYFYIFHGSFANGIHTAGFHFLFILTIWLLAGII